LASTATTTLGTTALDDVRRRVQQDTTGHRGRTGDPLYGIRTLLRAGFENLTDRQRTRLDAAINAHDAHDAHDAHEAVIAAWQCAQQLRAIYHQDTVRCGEQAVAALVDGEPVDQVRPRVQRLEPHGAAAVRAATEGSAAGHAGALEVVVLEAAVVLLASAASRRGIRTSRSTFSSRSSSRDPSGQRAVDADTTTASSS